ncbi:cytochrome C biogenesis protein [bacterium LRH843]|nr:cytochrome C biogenesis protein [bacterium LRH843]
MDKVKCECGFSNPPGTEMCESCGKPLEESKDTDKLLNMRYEGVARRSQTYTTTFIDKIWMFFSSVKVGIWFIVLLLVASGLGTIYPQEMYIPPSTDPAEYYKDKYGITGQLYYQLGFHNLYGSWWYMLLIAALGISLFIASLDRFVPLYRALKNQRVTRHANFMKRQRVFGTSKVDDMDRSFEHAKQKLKEKRYNISEENGNLVAEKGRFARWGPYVNHVGLILFLIGCMLRYFPGMYVDTDMWIREGETAVVPSTQGKYHVKNEEFIVELYDENDEVFGEAIERTGGQVAKSYQTNAILYERENTGAIGTEGELIEIDRKEIRVNDPLSFDGYSLYQMNYLLNELSSMSFTLENKETGEKFGRMDIDLLAPQSEYDLGNGHRVEVQEYFADFYIDAKNDPATKSKIPNNPVFIFKMYTPETPDGEVSFVGIRQNLEPLGENNYKMTFIDADFRDITGLTVRKDHTLWFLLAGGIVFMIGLIQGSYWTHRRIWLQRINGEIWVAGHTNKNYFSLQNDIEYVLKGSEIALPIDQEDKNQKKM